MATNATGGWFSADDNPAPSSPPRGGQTWSGYPKQTDNVNPQPPASDGSKPRARTRRYGPRTCRICLDTEQPNYPNDAGSIFGISSKSSRPEYVSDDPELGRLLSPCKCKGSQKYVHEGCLSSWRLSNPTSERNYWQCPTCKFSYRLARLHWASALSGRFARAGLTLVILILLIFFLGFLADPILNLWFDPVGTISDTVSSVVTDIEALKRPDYEEPTSWTEHFLKGFFSLGLVGFLKSMLAISPWHWWNLRSSGLMGSGRRQGTGRARAENINLVFVLIGVFTVLVGIWKGVKKLSGRLLKNISDRVLDVNVDDDDDDDDDDYEDTNPTGAKKDQ